MPTGLSASPWFFVSYPLIFKLSICPSQILYKISIYLSSWQSGLITDVHPVILLNDISDTGRSDIILSDIHDISFGNQFVDTV